MGGGASPSQKQSAPREDKYAQYCSDEPEQRESLPQQPSPHPLLPPLWWLPIAPMTPAAAAAALVKPTNRGGQILQSLRLLCKPMRNRNRVNGWHVRRSGRFCNA